MKLNVLERLMCLDCLPDTGSYVALRQLQEARVKLSFTAGEFKEFEIKELGDGKIQWNPNGNIPKKVHLSELVVGIIRRELEQLNSGEKLTKNHLSLYQKFFSEETKEETEK